MQTKDPSFSIGIEEEYFLIDPVTNDALSESPKNLMPALEAALGRQVANEFLQCQIEVDTKICHNIEEARADLIRLRTTVDQVVRDMGLRFFASSTHPFSSWRGIKHTNKERYDRFTENYQVAVRRLMICGLHVHIGIEDQETRIDLMNQASYFLPHLLALSCSSPFWQGDDTGLMSYRLNLFDGLPRTGIPDRLEGWGEYQRLLHRFQSMGIIEDGSTLWWDIRPSARFPTLEMRICDVPTHLEDSLVIAALFRCLLRMLYRLRGNNQRWRIYPHSLLEENRWRARRYGTTGSLMDLGRNMLVPFVDLVEELIELVHEDAQFFGCEAEIAGLRTIVQRGNSAQRQRQELLRLQNEGRTLDESLVRLVDWLVVQTMQWNS